MRISRVSLSSVHVWQKAELLGPPDKSFVVRGTRLGLPLGCRRKVTSFWGGAEQLDKSIPADIVAARIQH